MCGRFVPSQLPKANPAQVQQAMEAAQAAWPAWRRTRPGKRAEIFVRAAALMRERMDFIVRALTLELGQPLAALRLASGMDSHAQISMVNVCESG